MKKADFPRKEISFEEISIPLNELTEEELESIHYCNLADSQL